MKEPSHHVAVIGGGATGAALAIQLCRQLPPASRLVMLGSPREMARGVAYGTTLPAHLLNVRAGRMSVIHDDASHFTRWLLRQGVGGSEEEVSESYVPRATYGDYVHDTLKQAVAAAAGRVQVDMVESIATELVERDGVYTARAAQGIRYSARAMALCLGHGQPEFPLPAETIDPDARERMIGDPWADRRLGRIGRDDRVLIVGTGLTMVDQLLTLDARGHQGPVTAVSRRGFLPTGHCPRRTEPFLVPLPDSLRSIRELFRQIVAAARAEDAAGGDWRAVIDGLRPVTQDLWRRLDHAERRRFSRHVECMWSVVRHRMAPSIADRVATSVASGRLDVRAGRVVAVKQARHGVVVGLQARGGRTVELATFDWLLNCSGVGRVPVNAVEAPLGPLVSQGLIRADRLGRGIDITPESEAVGRTGRPIKGLYGLGPLGAGSLMEITAMPDIRVQCFDVAVRIAAELEAERRQAQLSGRSVLRLSG